MSDKRKIFTACFSGGPLDGQLGSLMATPLGHVPDYAWGHESLSTMALQRLMEQRACLPFTPLLYNRTGRMHLGGVPEYRCEVPK